MLSVPHTWEGEAAVSVCLSACLSVGSRGVCHTHVLELSLSRGAAGGVLAHTHGSVALVQLTHFPLLAVMVQAGVCVKGRPRQKLPSAPAQLRLLPVICLV